MSGPQPKRAILEISPYVPGKAKAEGFSAPLKLSANENALGCSPAALAAYRDAATTLHAYPDPGATALRDAIAAKHDLDPTRIIFGTGSDELFSLACQAYLSPGESMVQPQFAFAAWAIAARASGAVVRSAPERDYAVDVDAMLAAVDETTRVMFLANPANPTGTRIPYADIKRLHAALPEHVLLVLDGAYAEFADGLEDFEDGLALARSASNVLVTRTFSKLYGLAALRIGWGYAAAPVAETLNRIRLPFNAATPAQAAALAALGDDAFLAASVATAVRGRTLLDGWLRERGFTTAPSSANFVTALAPEGGDAREIEKALARQGVLVRWLGNYGLPNALRITAGDDASMARFCDALDVALS